MQPARIAELLNPFLGSAAAQNPCHSESGQRPGEKPAAPRPADDQRLTANDLEHISTYIDILLRWNSRINLTAIRSPEEIVTRHFGESLFAARHLFPDRTEHQPAAERRENAAHGVSRGSTASTHQAPQGRKNPTVADLGSGAGFPGLPIKLWAPHISLTLIESNHKKATFLREVTRALTLTDVNILTARAETLPDASYNLVTLRAVERFETVLPVAARLISPPGRLALLIGSSQLAAARSKLPQLAWQEPLSVPGSQTRVLAIALSSES
jgi:16S rRNA (guanine527-N7)-methyltransferase